MNMTKCERNLLTEIINNNHFYFVDDDKSQNEEIRIVFDSNIVDSAVSMLYDKHPEEVIALFEEYCLFPMGCDYAHIKVVKSSAKKTFGMSCVPIYNFLLTK